MGEDGSARPRTLLGADALSRACCSARAIPQRTSPLTLEHPVPRTPALLLAAGLLATSTLALTATASSPASSTLTASATPGADVSVTWTGTVLGGANADSDCTASLDDSLNDHHALTVAFPAGFTGSTTLTVVLTPDAPAVDDTILTVVPPQGAADSADNGGNGAPEQVSVTDPAAGAYDVLSCAFAGGPQPYTGKATLHTVSPNDAALPGGVSAGVTPPTYRNDAATTLGADAGEPSIGVNWKSGAVFLQSGLTTIKAMYDESGTPTFSDVSSVQTSITSLDPIAASDNTQGRIFVSQLSGFDSISAFSDDDGATWTSSQGGGIPSGVDHQTVGFGPYPKEGTAQGLTYPNAVYYCSQDLSTAFCARSDTGGLVFGAGIPIYTNECGGLHGHVRVAPDGTVYVPNKSCGGKQGFAVSLDAGLTWEVKTIPLSSAGDSDPSVAAGSDSTTYVGFTNGDGLPEVTVTTDHGATFSRPVNVGASLGIKNAAFPEVIAGDGDRAAMAFLGTTTEGNSQDADFGKDKTLATYTGGEYHLYIATTYDRGLTWTTVDATGKDPVQRGKICQRRHPGLRPAGPQPARLQRHPGRQAGPGPRRLGRWLHRHLRQCQHGGDQQLLLPRQHHPAERRQGAVQGL